MEMYLELERGSDDRERKTLPQAHRVARHHVPANSFPFEVEFFFRGDTKAMKSQSRKIQRSSSDLEPLPGILSSFQKQRLLKTH